MKKVNRSIPADEVITLGGVGPMLFNLGMAMGVAGFLVAFVLSVVSTDGSGHFLRSYLVSYLFFLSVALGALFFTVLHHLAGSGWSVVVRRVAEVLANNLWMMALLFGPILIVTMKESGQLFIWTNPGIVAGDELLRHKEPYLNVPFFLIRVAIYFAFWCYASHLFLRESLSQDKTGYQSHSLRLRRISPVTTLIFALTVSFAAFDLLMSTDPHWFSTIFGIFFFAGCMVAFYSTLILTLVGLQALGRIRSVVTVEHYHDLGKYLFGHIAFWAYIGFSQFMLIWYANIPEETDWYLRRMESPWVELSFLLIAGHFVIPFFAIMSRHVKRNPKLLAFWAVVMLVMHWIDLYWLSVPNILWSQEHFGLPAVEAVSYFGLMDVFLFVGFTGVFLMNTVRIAGANNLVPVRDPRLPESLAFQNY